MTMKNVRVLIAKAGLDGHDRGAKYVAQGLRDRGCEVIYTGIRRTPAEVVATAIQEDVKFLGLSSLSGGHVELLGKIAQQLREADAADIVLFAGGIIPAQDIPLLQSLGVAAVFAPGTTLDQIETFIRGHLESQTAPA